MHCWAVWGEQQKTNKPELCSAHYSHDINSLNCCAVWGKQQKAQNCVLLITDMTPLSILLVYCWAVRGEQQKTLSRFSAHHSHDTNSVCIGGQFGDSSRNPLSYVLLIISFVLAWVETWFLDFKVLPWERKELQKLAMPTHGTVLAADCLHLFHLNNNNVHLSRAYQCHESSHNSEIFMYLFYIYCYFK